MPAEAQWGDLQSAKTQDTPKYKISLLFTPLHTNHHLLIPQWMAPLTPSSARPVGHMTVLTTPPRRGRKASGCINKGAKGEEEPEADQTRWRWSSPRLTGCLQLQGFFCGPAVGRLHPWSATSTPEVRSHALKSYLDVKKTKCISPFFKKKKNAYFCVNFSLPCVVSALCAFEGRHYSLGETWMDNACMQCTCLHPVGVGCCETWVHKQPLWFGVQMPTVTVLYCDSRETAQSSKRYFIMMDLTWCVFMGKFVHSGSLSKNGNTTI